MSLNTNNAILSNAITVDSSYRVGIGTSSMNWNYGLLTPLQIRNASLYAYSDYELGIQTNSYYDGSWKYQGTNGNNLFQITLGTSNAIKFNYATYGTAGNVFTWTEAMRVTPTGAVGIGTSAPSYKLDVTGDGRFTSSLIAASFSTPSTGLSGSTTWNFYHDQYAAGDFGLWAGGTNRILINAAGNVGIGTSSPSYTLDVQVGGTATQRLRNNSAGGTATLLLETANTFSGTSQAYVQCIGTAGGGQSQLTFGTAGASGDSTATERMRITSAGQLCIGTSSASSNVRLNIARVSGAASIKAASDAGGNLVLESYDSSGQVYIQNYTAGDTYIGLGGGQVGIGITTGTSVNASLAIARDQTYPGDVNPATLILCGKTDTAKRMSMGYDTTSNYAWIVAGQYGVQWTSLYFQKSGGAVYAGSARIDNNSDIRVKDNIQPLTGALNKVLSMSGKKFHMLDEPEDKIRLGFIAQELEGVVDELVIHSDRTQTLPNGDIVENILGLETWGSSWAALLVEAIKEQQSTIKELEARIKVLENK